MKPMFAAVFLLIAMLDKASAASVPDYVTDNGGMLCQSFTDLPEAAKAFRDERWLLSLHCRLAGNGLPVIKIEELNSTEYFNPWKVRLLLPDGQGITVWGPAFSFKPLPQGTKP